MRYARGGATVCPWCARIVNSWCKSLVLLILVVGLFLVATVITFEPQSAGSAHAAARGFVEILGGCAAPPPRSRALRYLHDLLPVGSACTAPAPPSPTPTCCTWYGCTGSSRCVWNTSQHDACSPHSRGRGTLQSVSPQHEHEHDDRNARRARLHWWSFVTHRRQHSAQSDSAVRSRL